MIRKSGNRFSEKIMLNQRPKSAIAIALLAKNLDGWTFRPYTSARSNQEREFDPRGAESGCRMNGT
jgi:hypothetical protein